MEKLQNRPCLYIPGIDAKDIYLAAHCHDNRQNETGYRLRKADGTFNLRRYHNTFDYSLDLIRLFEVSSSLLPAGESFSFTEKEKEYSHALISLSFQYSVKEFNKVRKQTFIKSGYLFSELQFEDCLAFQDGEVVGIITGQPVTSPFPKLPEGFSFLPGQDCCYRQDKPFRTLLGREQLRHLLYEQGFVCEGRHYVRYKRSSGSARAGKCLFIDERLYPAMHQWEMCGLSIPDNKKTDLAALEAYISLSTSSIIDTMALRPESILVIPDYESGFTQDVILTEAGDNNLLKTRECSASLSNSIFDGQSLIDVSVMGRYKKYGMLLLRNRFFKSCCFNTNIQKWFQDNGIHSVSDLHKDSFTLARDISEIKLITTPSSIKYMKFGPLSQWLQNIDSTFGIVKYEKKTRFFGGKLVQTHYQLLNTLQLSKEEVSELLKPSLEYLNLLNSDPEVMRYHIHCSLEDRQEDEENADVMDGKMDLIFGMMKHSVVFPRTKMYYDFKKDICSSYLKNLKKGHILIDGNYSVLFGNPYEMLLQSIGRFTGETSLPPGTVHTTRYPFEQELLGCRSPHISTSNILLTRNKEHPGIDRYFNLTDEIICINAVNENILERLSGADFDSDQMIVTDNRLLIEAAKRNYTLFKVPANQVTADKILRCPTAAEKADLDFKTSENKIGEIVNLSQELNTIMWDKINRQSGDKEAIYQSIKEIYHDICRLNVMSCIEIDKAKKEFSVNNALEMKLIKERHLRTDEDGKTIKPGFIGYIAKTKGYYDPGKKNYQYHMTAMDYLLERLEGHRSSKTDASDLLPLCSCFEFQAFKSSSVKSSQVKKVVTLCEETSDKIGAIWSCDSYTPKEKYEYAREEKENLALTLGKLKINPHSMYRLITYTDQLKYSRISKLLFHTLFTCQSSSLTALMREIDAPVSYIKEDPKGDISLYGIKFKKCKEELL